MITNIYTDVARGRYNSRRVVGMGDVNSDAETLFAGRGIQADCKFIPYLGPMGGGTNVCDIAGDDAGYQYGSELVLRPGGLDILQAEVNSAASLVASRQAEQVQILARARELAAGGSTSTPQPAGVIHSGTGTQTYSGGQGVTPSTTPNPQTNVQVIQTATIQNQIGGAAGNPGTTAIQTAAPSGALFTIPSLGEIPMWAWLAAGGLGLYLATKGGR